ncbi:NeuD/PglB/VioB family sugar acetyltransferase [Cellulomonas fimi]|uniref:Acetyltransferase n=1 Tax=Cellulomonas fimi TaxID=1708 RepID=A0A7Y0QHQ5_CELFI|nr:NeuD/PglB/VioB family sugar acetyltransferase [Cellulomonas fimi]NMR21436.1 acetyltransferase [Cellulomonas fimi]
MAASGQLLLVAASGLAREVLALVRAGGAHEVTGFLDDDVTRRGTSVDGVPVLGGLEEVKHHPDAAVLLCVGRGAGRERLAARLADLGVDEDRYATVVHPGVDVPVGCSVGSGSILLAGVVLTAAVRVGRHVVVMPNATLTHDDVLEDFSTVCAGVALGGGVHVGRAAYLGMAASVRERVVVGAGATLGMGGVLLTDMPDGETWAGVPARPIHGPDDRSERQTST